VGLDLGDERDIRIVMMQLVEAKRAPAQFVVAKHRLQVVSHRRDQPVVDRGRNVIAKE